MSLSGGVRACVQLLDEPTNHLDLEACVWLEEYLKTYNKCLVLISHSQDFLNGVCTNIIWLTERKLTYYTGNYDTFMKTVAENETVQQKKYEKEQDDIKHIKAFIASCGTFANLVKQAKSKQKILDKMEAAGLTPPVQRRRTFQVSNGCALAHIWGTAVHFSAAPGCGYVGWALLRGRPI